MVRHALASDLGSFTLTQLREKAQDLGANFVLGTRIDFDEISGKGTQMFMVSAQGTAVKARRDSPEPPTTPFSESLPAEAVRKSYERLILKQECKGDIARVTPDKWPAIAEYQVLEAIRPVLQFIHSRPDLPFEISPNPDVVAQRRQTIMRNAAEFFRALPPDVVREHFGQILETEPELEAETVEIILALDLLDLAWIRRSLEHEDFRVRRVALRLLKGHQRTYRPEDRETLNAILELLPEAFPDKSKLVEKKGMFLKTAEQFWTCGCTTENRIENERCSNCSKDRRGLDISDYNLEAATSRVKLLIAAIDDAITSFSNRP